MVVEQSARGERAFDIYSRLLRGEHHLHDGHGRGLLGLADSWRSCSTSRRRTRRRRSPSTINSPGGPLVTSGLSIYDTMQFIRNPVSTLCVGQAASMGSLLLCAGATGHRFALPNARIMVHQPSGGFQGQATDILIHAREIEALKRPPQRNLRQAHRQGPRGDRERAPRRDYFMTADAAKEFRPHRRRSCRSVRKRRRPDRHRR